MIPSARTRFTSSRPDRMLVASVSVGAGHVRAAEALIEALRCADPARSLDYVDVLELAPGWARRVYRELFLRVAARSRALAYQMYLATDGDAPDNVRWGHAAERLVFSRFRRFLRAGGWPHCLATHFLPCQLADGPGRPALHLVVTDWALHRYWTQPYVENYFVASPEIAATLHRRLPRARVHVTGIPVAAGFGVPHDSLALRANLQFDAGSRVVLIMGGGWGLGVEDMVREALRAAVPDLVLCVVCGANPRAFEVLSRHPSERLRTLGFVNDVASLIAAADLVISKPGGVTTSETLAMGKPLLLTPGLPGHEDRNARVLAAIGAAQCVTLERLASTIEHFFDDSSLRERWIAAARAAGQPNAATRIAEFFRPAGMRDRPDDDALIDSDLSRPTPGSEMEPRTHVT